MFFFEVKKERKNLWGNASPKPRGALGGAGQEVNKNKQKGFEKFWLKTFSYVFLFFVLRKTKNLSRVNAFECGCTQTLDIVLLFMQFGD